MPHFQTVNLTLDFVTAAAFAAAGILFVSFNADGSPPSASFSLGAALMNRSHLTQQAFLSPPQELSRKAAFHEAGHAAAIYFGGKSRCLPPVYFQLYLAELNTSPLSCAAKIEGGRLIETLISSSSDKINHLPPIQKQLYYQA